MYRIQLKYVIFADKTNLSYSHEKIQTFENVGNGELTKISKKLSVIILNTNYMVFSKKTTSDGKKNHIIEYINVLLYS